MIGEFLLDLANILIGGGNKTVNEYSNAKKTGSSVNKSNVAKIGVDTTLSAAQLSTGYYKAKIQREREELEKASRNQEEDC